MTPAIKRWKFAEIITCHNICAAAIRICMDDLLIGDRNNSKQNDDGNGNRKYYAKSHRACRRQNYKDFLCGICCGRKRIGCENGKADGLLPMV